MRVLVTTHAQLYKTRDGKVWTKSVYGYDFFKRYLDVFDIVRLVCRLREVNYQDVNGYLRVDGENLEIYPLPFYRGPWEYIKTYLQLKKEVDTAIDGCDCALLRIPDQFSFQLYKTLKRRNITCAVEVVAHPWDLFAPGNNKTILRPLIRYYWDYMQRKICSEVDGVAYVTKDYIQKRYPSKIKVNDKKRIETSYTSAEIKDTYFYRAKKQCEFIKDNKFQLIHISGINDFAKGHKVLLEALSILKKKGVPFNMTFVGGGVLLDYFKGLRDQLDLYDEVIFVGNVSERSKITKLLIKSDILVFPSMSEGLPRVVIEAMAAGLPCIASDIGGTSELVSAKFLLKSAKEVDDIVDKILMLCQSKDLLEIESYHNFTLAKEKYNAEYVQSKRNKFYAWIKVLVKQNDSTEQVRS